MNNYETIGCFKDGILEDARLFGDGYDFQIEVQNHFFLSEVKGIRANFGSIRMTQNEFLRAKEYNDDYALIVVSNLDNIPKMKVIFNPTESLKLTQKIIESKQYNYHSESILWENFH
jgi:hypothetical protein